MPMRKRLNTTRMQILLAPEHIEAARRLGGTVSKGVRIALHCYGGALTGPVPSVAITTGYRKICITITPGSKLEAATISAGTVVAGIRIALEDPKLWR